MLPETEEMTIGHRTTWLAGAAPFLCMAGLVGVLGCATAQPTWTKPGATCADLRRDLTDCEREATGPQPFHLWALSMDYDTAKDRIPRVKRQCMQARGWRLADALPGGR
jgi:hypothetical protein